MIRWLLSFFAWREVRDTGVWLYLENDITGARRVVRVGGGWQPVNADWLERRAPRSFNSPPPRQSK